MFRSKVRCLVVSTLLSLGAAYGSLAIAATATVAPGAPTRSAPELIAAAPADDGSRPACKGARKYLDLINSGRVSEIGALFAENVVFYGPRGKTLRGRAAVQEMYNKGLANTSVQLYGAAYLQDGNSCVLEIVAKDGSKGAVAGLGALDHFTVNKDGLFERFIMYMSPPDSLPKGDFEKSIRGFMCGASAAAPGALPTRNAPELIVPAPKDDGSKPVCKAARKYIELVNSGRQEEISKLFSEDVIFYGPRGEINRGRAAVHSSFTKNLAGTSTEIYGASFIQDGNNCLTELVSRPRGSNEPFALMAIDHFSVNKEGLVDRFVMFASPLSSLPNSVAKSIGGRMCPASGDHQGH